jgi:hypothetical protein
VLKGIAYGIINTINNFIYIDVFNIRKGCDRMAVTKKNIKEMISGLEDKKLLFEDWVCENEDAYDNECDKDNPNEDKLSKLDEQKYILEEVVELLDGCIEKLNEYLTL